MDWGREDFLSVWFFVGDKWDEIVLGFGSSFNIYVFVRFFFYFINIFNV